MISHYQHSLHHLSSPREMPSAFTPLVFSPLIFGISPFFISAFLLICIAVGGGGGGGGEGGREGGGERGRERGKEEPTALERCLTFNNTISQHI